MTITNICDWFTSHDYPLLHFDQIKKFVQFSECFSYQQVVILITLLATGFLYHLPHQISVIRTEIRLSSLSKIIEVKSIQMRR